MSLGELGKCISGLTYSPGDVTNTTGLLVLRSSNVQNGKLSFEDNVYVSKTIPEESLTKKGDILVCVRNGSRNLIGKNCLITKEAVGCAHGAFMTLFRSTHSEFIYQLLQTERYYSQVRRNLGATINSINTSDFYEFIFSIPPVGEEQKITAILRTWDEAIEKYQAYLSTISNKRKLIVQKSFGPKHWPLAAMVDVADIIVSNVDKKSNSDHKPVRLCNYMDVFSNRYITSGLAFMESTASDREIATYSLKKGDAIFTKDSETPEDIAVCASLEEEIDGLVCGYHLAIARPKQDTILGTFLAEAINSPHVHHQFYRAANGATRFGLTRGDIDEVKLPLPPLAQQKKIVAALRQCDREKELTEKKIKNLQSQKRGLMQKLLTGAWRVQPGENVINHQKEKKNVRR